MPYGNYTYTLMFLLVKYRFELLFVIMLAQLLLVSEDNLCQFFKTMHNGRVIPNDLKVRRKLRP
jgi:hypothetical protein